MPEPINYMAQMQQPNLGGDILDSLKLSQAIRGIRSERAADQQVQDLQAQFKTDFADYQTAPSSDKLINMQMKYPQMKDAFAPAIANMNQKQLDSDVSTTNQVISALQSGNSDIAHSILDEHITANENSGLDTAKLKDIKRSIEVNPTAAAAHADFVLANLIGPEKYAKLVEARGKQQTTEQEAKLFPSKLKEAESKATTATSESVIKTAEANNIDKKIAMDFAKSGWDIKKIVNDIDISKQNARINAMKAQIEKAGLGLKGQELGLKAQELGLKVKEAQIKLNDTIREKVTTASSALDTNDNILNSIDRILAVPKGVRESAHGPISSKIPTLSSDTADYEAMLDTLGSQAFLSQIASMKGMGALSDAEGKKLQAGMQNLSLTQSSKQAEQNVREMKKLVLKARKNIENKYGVKAQPPESSFKGDADTQAIFSKYGIK